MNIKQRNKLIAISRWKKVQKEEKEYIEKNYPKNNYLKMRLLGYLAGDGNISIRKDKTGVHHLIRFFPDHPSLIKPFAEASQKVYNKLPIIKELRKHYMLRIYSKTVVLDILKEGKLSNLAWRLPKSLSNKKSKREWLRAFFDSEASVSKDKITIGSVNRIGIKQVKKLLLDFDVNSKIYEYTPKNKKWNKVYILTISKKADKKTYLHNIGFNHILKIEKLKKSLC